MIRTEGLLPDGQGPLVQGFGLLVPALVVVEVSEVVEAAGHLGVVGTEGLLLDGQRAGGFRSIRA